MYKCPLCEKSYENGRQLHGHMLKAHQKEYKEKYSNRVANIGSVAPLVSPPSPKAPVDLKLLDLRRDHERAAYDAGFSYKDAEFFYTAEEVKEKGWV